eukprot:CAMPEP_0178417666 /NCGR_PEP_ID=MMETSP0689_2-20121128/24688_1 /TAXON_ID=160604 /ORGANISM="Amphidinium massartii, Strain CS-259" /LENGTH=516 /DNA_ID=CAMNT_0020039031 /DNA_START=70 /DNA_END=1620 /DNA_ORIENTATION=+
MNFGAQSQGDANSAAPAAMVPTLSTMTKTSSMASAFNDMGVTVKNTFLQCEEEPEGLDLRKVRSEPASRGARRFSAVDEMNAKDSDGSLSIDTDSVDNGPDADSFFAESGVADSMWPPTPEVHNMSCSMSAYPSFSSESTTATDSKSGTASLGQMSWQSGPGVRAVASQPPMQMFMRQTPQPQQSQPHSQPQPRQVQPPPPQQQQQQAPVCVMINWLPLHAPAAPQQAVSGLALAPAPPSDGALGSSQLVFSAIASGQPAAAGSPPSTEASSPVVPSDVDAVLLRPRSGKAAAIACLQELLQSAEHTSLFKFPPGVKVLQWSYQQKTAGRLVFRAFLAFLCNGVPHHVTGNWHQCKKDARQAVAEMALALVQGQTVDTAAEEDAAGCADLSGLVPLGRGDYRGGSAKALESYLASCSCVTSTQGMEWSTAQAARTGTWQAQCQVKILGMKFSFSGPALPNPEEAKNELASRVMWYMGCEDYQGLYVPNRRALMSVRCEVPAAPAHWMLLVSQQSEK